jgi:hypothetical protein
VFSNLKSRWVFKVIHTMAADHIAFANLIWQIEDNALGREPRRD